MLSPATAADGWLRRAKAVSLWAAIAIVLLPSRAAAQTGVQPWSLTLSGGTEVQDNAELSPQGGSRATGSRFDVDLNRVWQLHRGRVTVDADANQVLFYGTPNALGTLSYGVGGTASFTVTRRLSLGFSDTVSSSLAQDSHLLTDAGLVFAKTVTHTNALGTQMAYDLSPRTHVVASLTAVRVSFDSPDLTGGSTFTPQVALTRQLTRSQTIGLSYAQTISDGITGDIQGLLATWQASVGKRFTVTASGGIRPYVLAGQQGHQYAPGGGGGLSAQFGRAGKASVVYERAVEQAFGFNGTHLAHRVNAVYEATVGKRLALESSFAYGLNTYPLDPTFRLQGRTLVSTARYRIVRNLGVSVLYGIWEKLFGDDAPVTSTRSSVALTYGVSWR